MTADESEINHYLEDEEEDGEWGEPVKPTSRKRLDAIVSVRFSPDELERIRSVAPEGNVSNYIRAATLREAVGARPDWALEVASNGSARREYGYVVSFHGSASITEAGMVLANWNLPSVQLSEAS
jgi:hypothetical protein